MSEGSDVTRVPPPKRGGGSAAEERASGITFSIERILGKPQEEEEPAPTAPEKPPIWIYCSRFSARPTAGPRRRSAPASCEDRRCRTAFTGHQVSRLKAEFQRSEYLSEAGRRDLAQELDLTEAQVKIWFQNARAKRRRNCGRKSPLAQKLAEAGLYNHSANSASAS